MSTSSLGTSPFAADTAAEKALVRRYHAALSSATPGEAAEVLRRYTAPDWHWRGMHPFQEQYGAEAVAGVFWTPLKIAFTRLQRRPDIFMAGLNEIDGFKSVWVVSMGHLMGLFERHWLGIRPNGRVTMLRYAEFNRIENGRIAETAMFCDIPQVMIQAGQNPFPPQTGAHLVQPGPQTHEGLMWGRQDPKQGEATLSAINAMLNNPGEKFNDPNEAQRLARVWQDNMIWWGPAGIGASYTIQGYIRQHTKPFDDAFSSGDYNFNGHLCRLAEGHFGGFFGWANLTLRSSGGYLGMTAGPGKADMRVVDIYREENGRLAENWIFIDILHYLAMQGLDVLTRNADVQYL